MGPCRPRDGDDERDGPDPSNLSVYEGERDAEGRPHGRGRLRLDDQGVWHEGRFVHGARHGRGTLRFPPDDYEPGRGDGGDSESDSERGDDTRQTRPDGSSIPRRLGDDFPVGGDRLAGTFVDGVLHGPAVYHSADGSSRKGAYVRGELTGSVEEFDASGALVFRGDYVDGVRHGDGVLRQPDGSVVVSYWHEGAQGCEGIFIYPRAYGVPVDATLRDKVPTKCRGYGRDEEALESAISKLANLTEPPGADESADAPRDGTASATTTRPSFLFGTFARPRARRDTLAGEAAFFARHDEIGVVRAGSCWARFDEFEGVSKPPGFEAEGFVSYRRDDFGGARNRDDVRLREWLRRETRAWREPIASDAWNRDEASGFLSAASPEPLDRSRLALERANETRQVETNETARGDVVCVVRARRRLTPNDVVGFAAGVRRVVVPRGGFFPGVAPTRWRPTDRVFYARELLPGERKRGDAKDDSDDSDDSETSGSSSSSDDASSSVRDATDDHGRAVPFGGLFFCESEARPRFEGEDSPLTTLGGFVHIASTATRSAPSTRRAPFVHPALGLAFALVAAETVPAGAAPTQPPDYACGWALHPASEAGYYHHLRFSPPVSLLEAPGTANLGAVRVTRHGPWRALWLDGFEQGLAYDARFRPKASLKASSASAQERFAHDPHALGFEYVRAMATAALASVGAAELEGRFRGLRHRALCVGLGAGSLPAFLANAFLEAPPSFFRVEAVEIDRDVVTAAREALGVAFRLSDEAETRRSPGAAAEEARSDEETERETREVFFSRGSPRRKPRAFGLHLDDAARFVRRLVDSNAHARSGWTESQQSRFALVCLDAYDGKGAVPARLRARAFLRDARRALAPGGAIVANCFYGPPGSRARGDLLAFCEALGGDVPGACDVRVRLVKVEGQESNVVVVAETARREPGAFSSRAAFRGALAAAAARVPAEARAALCDGDRVEVLEVSEALAGAYEEREADEEAKALTPVAHV